MSQADSGKGPARSSTRSDTARPRAAAAPAAGRGESARGAASKSSAAPARPVASKAKVSEPSRGKKKKKAAAKPVGPAVYASDLVAGAAKTGASGKESTALPDSIDTTGLEALELSPIQPDLPMEHRPAQVLRLAEEAFARTGSWVVFYRTMMAPGGVVDQLYDNPVARRYFETTGEFAELLEMVTAIRSQDDSSSGTHEPTRMITVRVPRSLHAAAVRESEELELSINAYCVTKLLQPANPRFTPLELGNRRGRRPGPQMVLETKVKAKPKSRASKR